MSNRSLSQFTDSDLLSHYAADGNQWAFEELVNRYQSLVLGAAYRRSGDVELARDVTQQVFAVLARKANSLADRGSLAGWLHQATMFETSRTLQSEYRRANRHQLFVLENPERVLHPRNGDDSWAVLDEAMDELPIADREAVAMHFFQDLSYGEMSAILGVKESAVRKRVSRALQRLGDNLRDRGARQTAAALLAAAVTVQNTLVVPSGLAKAALVIAAAGGGSTAFMTLAAVMSKTVMKAAAVVAAAAVVYTVRPTDSGAKAPASAENNLTSAATDSGIAANSAPPAAYASTGATAQGAFGTPALSPNGTAGSRSGGALTVNAQSGATGSQQSPEKKEKAGLTAAERDDVARAVGKELADRQSQGSDTVIGTPVPQTTAIGNALSAPAFFPDLGVGAFAPAVGDLPDELPLLPELLQELELFPGEAADFVATAVNEAIPLTLLEDLRLRRILEGHFIDKAVAGFAGPRPEAIDEIEWLENRALMNSDTVNQVAEAVPLVSAVPEVVQSVLSVADEPLSEPVDELGSALGSLAGSVESVASVAPIVVPTTPIQPVQPVEPLKVIEKVPAVGTHLLRGK